MCFSSFGAWSQVTDGLSHDPQTSAIKILLSLSPPHIPQLLFGLGGRQKKTFDIFKTTAHVIFFIQQGDPFGTYSIDKGSCRQVLIYDTSRGSYHILRGDLKGVEKKQNFPYVRALQILFNLTFLWFIQKQLAQIQLLYSIRGSHGNTRYSPSSLFPSHIKYMRDLRPYDHGGWVCLSMPSLITNDAAAMENGLDGPIKSHH